MAKDAKSNFPIESKFLSSPLLLPQSAVRSFFFISCIAFTTWWQMFFSFSLLPPAIPYTFLASCCQDSSTGTLWTGTKPPPVSLFSSSVFLHFFGGRGCSSCCLESCSSSFLWTMSIASPILDASKQEGTKISKLVVLLWAVFLSVSGGHAVAAAALVTSLEDGGISMSSSSSSRPHLENKRPIESNADRPKPDPT